MRQLFNMRCALGVILLFAFGPAQAATVAVDGTVATGILDLDVGGTVYNVAFEYGTFDAINTGSNFLFLGDQTGAEDARAAILLELNLSSANQVGPDSANTSLEFLVPWLGGGLVSAAAGAYNTSTGVWVDNGSGAFFGADTYITSYAIFTVVPIPAAVWLFGSGLGLLGWFRRKA